MKWILAEHQLPDPDVMVLTIDSSDNDFVLCWIDAQIGGWVDRETGSNNYVTHWMPLPEPPK